MFITCPHCHQTFELAPEGISPLRKARMDKGISIQEAAADIGMSHWALSRLERGTGNPKLSVLKGISAYYGSSIDDLFPEPPVDDGEVEPEVEVEEETPSEEDEYPGDEGEPEDDSDD